MSHLLRKTASILILALLFASAMPLFAQTPAQQESPELSPAQQAVANIEEASNGNIDIEIDDSILELIFSDTKPQAQKQQPKPQQKKQEKVSNSGYRVQVFGEAGNQGTLASRCRARGSMVLAKFPKYRGQMYVFSRSPNWYCRVGNFKTAGEAAKAASEIKRSFPQFAGEVRVVKSTIVNK